MDRLSSAHELVEEGLVPRDGLGVDLHDGHLLEGPPAGVDEALVAGLGDVLGGNGSEALGLADVDLALPGAAGRLGGADGGDRRQRDH